MAKYSQLDHPQHRSGQNLILPHNKWNRNKNASYHTASLELSLNLQLFSRQ